MAITFRNYSPEPFFTDDYVAVRNFLIRINSGKLYTPRFLWGAWEWAVTHRELDRGNLDRIGLWEEDGKLVALATYEGALGEVFLIVDENYGFLKPELIEYAQKALHVNGKLRILIRDGDQEFVRAAAAKGFCATQRSEHIAALDINALQPYELPDGFSFVSFTEDWNWQQYHRLLRLGFGSEGEVISYDDETISGRKAMLSSPMIIPELVISVVAPDGKYASHCGMWYRPGEFYCYVEPVATDPVYRKMGLGKAAVLEAVRRCGELGASLAVIVSNQQFYYNIGCYPIHTETWWEQK